MPDPVAEVVERLRKAADNIERARMSGIVESLAGWEQRHARDAADLLERLSRERDTGVPEGFWLAPIKPTDEIMTAAAEAHFGKRRTAQSGGIDGIGMTVDGRDLSFRDAFKSFWKGARSAAPQPPTVSPDIVALNQAREALARTERNRDMWKDQCARQADQLSAINELPQECVNSLTHQRQIDMDGCEVGVSRQAVDEIHAALMRARSVLNPEKEEKA